MRPKALWLFGWRMTALDGSQNKKTVFSGIQPSGLLTIGNYFGAIKNWSKLQDKHLCIFCVVDLHAITSIEQIPNLKENVLSVAAFYIAAGLDPNRAIIFQQSQVSEHTELSWILSTQTPLGWLNRMTQFKSKVAAHQEDGLAAKQSTSTPINGHEQNLNASLGLYAYPVLMAADILLYQADIVPVGEDQVQHIELARDIAGAFNRKFGKSFFKLPQALVNNDTKRIMSLKDAKKKMSKSDRSDASRINLCDSNDLIVQKIKRAKTDSLEGISFDEERRPEISNLIRIYAACLGLSALEAAANVENYSNSKFKSELADALIQEIAPVRDKAALLLADSDSLLKTLQQGSEAARNIETANLAKDYEAIGIR